MTLEYEGYRVDEARSGQDGLDKAGRTPYDAILLDIKMPILDGIEVLENLKTQRIGAPVIMVSGHGDVSTAVECTKRGAFDFLEKPLNRDKLLLAVRNAVRQQKLEEENIELRDRVERDYQIVGDSLPIKELRAQIELAAPTKATVLIQGESGSGKELVAREIHRRSSRANGMFVHGLDPIPTNFSDKGTIPMLRETFLFWRISKGGPGLPDEGGPWDTAMPSWEKFLKEEEMWDAILFLYDFTASRPRGKEEVATK